MSFDMNIESHRRALDILKSCYGHSEFRAGQWELISSALKGEDVLGIMPTGGGKSLCYQIPAMLMPGVALVISPLISLMKDRVASLVQMGVPAAYRVLFHGEKVSAPLRAAEKRKEVQDRSGSGAADDGLLTALKALRYRLSQEQGLPAYLIFSNASLSDMASKAPRDMESFMSVNGVGEKKAQRYAELFLRVISDHLNNA